jgi:hypothetical protein
MAREDGSVNARREAWLRVRASGSETLDCLIDTGFDGALVLPRFEATRLNLTVLGRVPIIGVGGIRAIADIAELRSSGWARAAQLRSSSATRRTRYSELSCSTGAASWSTTSTTP